MDVPLWHHITQGVFPIKGTLSKECLERCRVMLEEKVGKKGIDWQVFQKWERESQIRKVKSLAGQSI